MSDDQKVAIVMSTGANNARMLEALAERKVEIELDTVTTPPTITGPHGRAWRIDPVARANGRPDAGVVAWMVEAPWAHPAWHSYAIVLISLRPIEGLPDPKIYRDGATHEMVVFALNPDESRQATLDGGVFRQLTPCNFAGQFIEIEDGYAMQRIECAVLEIIHGQLSPDTDFRHAWINRFGDHMIKKG